MREALNNSPALTSLYVGYGNGDFFMVRRIWNDGGWQDLQRPARYRLHGPEHRPPGRRDARPLHLPRRRDSKPCAAMTCRTMRCPSIRAPAAGTRQRMTAGGQIKTPPYLFFTSQQVGTTIANRANSADAVVGADIRLETLGRSVWRSRRSRRAPMSSWPTGRASPSPTRISRRPSRFPDGPAGKPVLANIEELGIPVLGPTGAADCRASTKRPRRTFRLTVDGADWHASLRPVKLEGAAPLFLITAIPDDELMADAQRLMRHALIATILVILLAIPITWGSGAPHFRTPAPTGRRGGSDPPLRVLAADQGQFAGPRSQ